jgi:hypothetical protein
MSVGFKRFNYFPTPTAWQQTIGWRRRRLEADLRIQEQIEPIRTALANAQASQISGVTEITLTIANARIQKEAAAKVAKLREEALAQLSKV